MNIIKEEYKPSKELLKNPEFLKELNELLNIDKPLKNMMYGGDKN